MWALGREPIIPALSFSKFGAVGFRSLSGAAVRDLVMRRRRQTGRHIAYAQRSGSVVAIVGEVEIDRRTGKVRARRFTGTHDRRLIINPDGLRRCIEGNVVQ